MAKTFKNNKPQKVANSWQGVDLFLHTWGDLPGRPGFGKRLMKLDKQELADLCELALDASVRLNLEGDYIKVVQNKILSLGLYEEETDTNQED